MYLAKNSRAKRPATDIINEVLCYHFLTLWNIPVPPIAIIHIDPEDLPAGYSNNHKKQYYNIPVFGSKWLKEAVDSNRFFQAAGKSDIKNFNNPMDIFKIGLFDIWIENEDRRPGHQNLLFQPVDSRQTITAIDHCFSFSTMNYSDLRADNFCPIANENILVSELAQSLIPYKNQTQNPIERDREYFYFCISRCKEFYPHIVKSIPGEWGFTGTDASFVFQFLFDDRRNKQVFEDYISKVI